MDRRRAAGALFALAACFATATAAPTSNHTALDLYDGPTEGCYYNFQHYGEGDRIMTNEPCLNCTCHNRMLMCYLRVCPFTKPIGQDCTVEKRADQCCPIVTCPDVPVDLLTSTSTTSPAEYGGTGVGKVDNYGCSINGKYFPEGAKVPPTPNKPCEHCYCIRNMTTCVMQECTLHVDGCTPIYHKDVCCPVRYFCDHPEDEPLQLDDMTTTVRPTPGFLLTTTTTEAPTTETQSKRECTEDGQIYPDGALIKTEKPCVHCYCMKGDIVCVVQECGTPMENEGKNCTSMRPREGQCCPDTYICEGDEITTELALEEITTILPSEITTRRENIEGSGYRKEPGETYTEPSISFETEGSGQDELLTTMPSDLTPKEQTSDSLLENKFGVTDQGLSSIITTESPAYEVKEQDTTETDKGVNTVPSAISEDEHSEPSIVENTTVQEDTMTTVSSTSLPQEISVFSTSPRTDTESLETTPSGEIIEKSTVLPSVQIEDESSQVSTKDEDEITESSIEAKLTTVSDYSKTTPLDKISEGTTEPIIVVPTTVKSDSVTEVKLSDTTPEEVLNEITVTNLISHSSEPPLKEKITTIHELMVTEPSTATEEKEISSPVIQEESTTKTTEATEPAVTTEEQTTYKEVISENTPEPSLIENTTSVDAVTDSKVHETTVSNTYEDDTIISSTHKIVEDAVKSTEPAAIAKATTTEEPDATTSPMYEQTLVPGVQSEGESTTEQISEPQINEERVSTFAPSTEVVPQEEKQDTTDTVITTLQPRDKIPVETTTLNPEDNEITEDILPPGRIPGEGDCLFNGVTYKNESSVPNRNKCESSCKCVSSIIKCDPIICSPPPEYMENCQLVYDTSESCCPTYICEETKETIPPQSHSQMSGTESPTFSPSLHCSGDECEIIAEKQTTTVLPDSTKIPSVEDCGSEGCAGQVPEKTNISGEQPEQCVGDKCTSVCIDGNCQTPSSQVTPQDTPSKTMPQGCQGSEECREDKTEVPVCQGEDCISKTTTYPEISMPCEGPSCPVVPQDCTSDKCIASENAPTETPPVSQVCPEGKDCKQIEEKDCQDDNCRRAEEHDELPIQSLPPKCTDPGCQHQEPLSPGAEATVTLATTEQILLESTLSPESHSISDSGILPESVITDSSSEKTTSAPQIIDDYKVPVTFGTETPEKSKTTQFPQTTEGLEGENTVPHEEITETEMHSTELPMITTSEVYTEKEMVTKTTESDKEDTTIAAVTEGLEIFTTSPVETQTQREVTSSKSPEYSLDETETEKPQTSEFEPKQPDHQEQFTKAPELEQPTETTGLSHDEQTEIVDQHLPSTSIPSIQQDIEQKTSTEFIDQSTIMPEYTEKLGETENIPTISEDIELPEKTEEQERTTITPELEKKTTMLSLPDSAKQSTTQPQQFTSISTEELETTEETKTDLPAELITDLFKPEKEETATETSFSPDTISYDTESPIKTDEGDQVLTEIPETLTKRTESPILREQTEGFEPHPTTLQSIITETTTIPEEIIISEQEIEEKEHVSEVQTTETSISLETKPSEEPHKTEEHEIPTETTVKPEEIITPEQEMHEEEQHPEMPTTNISLPSETETSEEPDKIMQPELLTTKIPLSLDTKPSEESDKTVQPELPTKTTDSHIPEPTESTMLPQITSEKENITDKPMPIETELNIPVTITEEPSEGTKETEESQMCDSESECKKLQVPESEISPCQGDSCIQDKKGCDSSECSQSGLPPNTTSTEICDKESGCGKPLQEEFSECSDENCRKPEISDHEQTPISDIEITTKTPNILEEELQTKLPFEPHLTVTETPATEVPTFGIDKTTKEPLIEESENEVTRLPVPIITNAPIAMESHKFDTSERTEVTQPEGSVTVEYEVTTTEPKKSETELPTYHDIIPENDITVVPEQFPTEHEGTVTETPVPGEVIGVQGSSTEAVELPKSTERGYDITEQPKISSPEENEVTTKSEIDISQSHIPEHLQPEISQTEIATTGYTEVTTLITEEDDKLKDEESETEGPAIFVTTPGFSTREPEINVSQQSEDEVPETTESEITSTDITELSDISEKTTESQKEYSETTPYLVELEEHPHEIKESISTLSPSEETITQEPTDIHDTEKEQDIEMTTQKASPTEPSLLYTEKPSEDNLLSETSKTDTLTTISEQILEKSTQSSISEEASSEPNKPPSSDQQVPDSTTKPKDEENEISTVLSVVPETQHTTQATLETDKPHTAFDENMPETTQGALSSPTSSPEEEFIQATTKATSPKIDEDIATQSPSGVDKPETSTDVYSSVHTAETQKPVFSDIPPTDEVPQPEDESHFPPSGGYEPEPDYGEEDQFGPGTCRYGGKVYVSAQQIPRDDPCDFCFCFRSDIICLQQSCPPPIHGCREEPIQGFCCPRYECPVSMATTLNVTTTTTTTTTTLPPHFLPHAYKGAAQRKGCQIKGHIYKVGEVVRASSGPCLHCTCGGDGQMKCDPKVCTPEPMLRQMIAAAVSAKRRR